MQTIERNNNIMKVSRRDSLQRSLSDCSVTAASKEKNDLLRLEDLPSTEKQDSRPSTRTRRLGRQLKKSSSERRLRGTSTSSSALAGVRGSLLKYQKEVKWMAAKRSRQRNLLRAKSTRDTPEGASISNMSVTSVTENDLTENSLTSIDSSWCKAPVSPKQRKQPETPKRGTSLREFFARSTSLRSMEAPIETDSVSQASNSSNLKRTPSSRLEMMMEVASQSSVGSFLCACSSHERKIPRQVTFAVDKEGVPLEPQVYTYEGPAEQEKALMYDHRPEAKVFASAKWLAACKLVPGAGVFKHAVDVAYKQSTDEPIVTPSRLPLFAGLGASLFQDVSNTVVFQKSVETIAASDLRGLEQVYSAQLELHRNRVLEHVLEQAWRGRRGASLAKYAAEATRSSAQFSRMLAMADAIEVERYLSGIP